MPVACPPQITPRTKVLVLNSPHNPTGKTFSAAEMAQVAEVVRRHPRLLVISDEVYKYTVYSGEPHQHFAALPGMFDRTLTVSSAGKTFSVTGWQARPSPSPTPHPPTAPAYRTHARTGGSNPLQPPPPNTLRSPPAARRLGGASAPRTSSSPSSCCCLSCSSASPRPCSRLAPRPRAPRPRAATATRSPACPPARHRPSPRTLLAPLQALSQVLTRADEPYTAQGRTSSSYYEWLTDTFRHKRDVLAKGLERSGIVPMEGQGGFFLMADTSALRVPEEYMRHTTPAAPQARRAAATPTHPPSRTHTHPRTHPPSHPRTTPGSSVTHRYAPLRACR